MALHGNVLFGYLCVVLAIQLVQSENTAVRGTLTEYHGLTTIDYLYEGKMYNVTKFLGIPYAKPPVGELRFKKSEPIKDLPSPFDATMFGTQCIQFTPSLPGPQSEDCLYLNIYVPNAKPDSSKQYAVAVYIHGGGFMEGNGNIYESSILSTFGDVIVVTLNYRLGLYGFLSTMDENAPGNTAFWDQHMAFQWVHDNIGDFGGDNERVTIFGGSAGAVSVSRQAFITQNRGLFQRMIAQSGSVLITTPPDDKALENAQLLGSYVECVAPTTKELIHCLRNKSTEELKAVRVRATFGYVIDNVLITEHPSSLLEVKDTKQNEGLEFYRSLDVMNGFNLFDGMLMYQFTNALDQFPLANLTREGMKSRIQMALYSDYGPVHDSVIEMILAEYTNWTSPYSMEEATLQLIKLYGDRTFGTPAIKSAQLHEQWTTPSSSYFFHFVAKSGYSMMRTPEWLPGANHADEVAFVFGMKPFTDVLGYVPEKWETELSQQIMRYWTNFVKSGDPNVPVAVSPWWPEYKTEHQHYISFEQNTTQKSIGQFLYARETNFWYDVFPTVNDNMMEQSWECKSVSSSAYYVIPKLSLVVLMLAFILYL